MADLLAVRALMLAFGGLRALDGVDLSVEEGCVAGLIGPNGAGKTSLLNCISRFYQPQAGAITFGGADLLRYPAHALPALGLARTFQQIELFGAMSVLENVQVGAHAGRRAGMWGEALRLPGARSAEREQRRAALAILDLVGMGRLAARRAEELSLGQRKRVSLARALAAHPRLLLLDEPAGGLNSAEKRELMALLRTLRADLRLTIVLIEHDMDVVMGLCDTLTVLDFGKRIAAGTPDQVRRDPAVIAAYLGVAPDPSLPREDTEAGAIVLKADG